MKTATILFAAFAFAAGSAFAQAPAAPATTTTTKQPTAQQQKLGDCAKQAHAKGLKGADYKSFMSTCASGSASATPAAAAAPAAAAKPMTQQEKMKACNADAKAKTLSGDARKSFMSSCLKGDGAAAAAQ
jgi:hypothetical protein